MKRLGSTLVMAAVAAAFSSGVSLAGQAPPVKKLVAPVRGEANVEITNPDTRMVKDQVVTKLRVKNVMKSPIAGFKVEENWFKGSDAIGGDSYRHPRPLQVGEVIEITLSTPRARVVGARNQYQFSHANGVVKPKAVKVLPLPKPTT
jgi:hypothetical protein